MVDRRELILELGRDPALAHAVLFAERHSDDTPPFHLSMIRDWHSPHPRVVTTAFRGAAKSTRAEEAILISACLQKFKNIVILGNTEARARDRLTAIKFEIDNNEILNALFELRKGSTWGERKLVLMNGTVEGCMIQAYGRGQALRGIKYLNARPDLIFCDDLEEDEESVRTPEIRERTWGWFFKAVLGTLSTDGIVRVSGTPLDPEALLPRLMKQPGWKGARYPIESVGPKGERLPTWPSRYPIEWIDRKKAELTGRMDYYMQEYMCEATDPATRVFLQEHFKFASVVPSWHAVYAVYDPARTVKQTSATTGKVVFSWIRNRLVVWEADAQKLLPDAIIKDIFDTNEKYQPVLIGVEETGLNEFIMQPLRQEQVKRSSLVPLRALNAPRGKLDFIRSLQPFFKAGQVEFASNDTGMQLLQQQLLGFPTGNIDAPNALAYALILQPQQPVYDAFDGDIHIAQLLALPQQPAWLAVNATQTLTTAILVQVQHGIVRVLVDWLREGDPGLSLADIVKEARLELVAPALRLPAKGVSQAPTLRLTAPAEHWAEYDIVGLRAVASRVPVQLQRGGTQMAGREELRDALTHSVHGSPAFAISPRATWTLRALTGGYAYRQRKTELELVSGPYAVLMAGLEAFVGLLRSQETDDSDLNFSYTAQGHKYLSALAR